jgi:hypothetical protein
MNLVYGQLISILGQGIRKLQGIYVMYTRMHKQVMVVIHLWTKWNLKIQYNLKDIDLNVKVHRIAAVITDKYFSFPTTNGCFLSIITFHFFLETSKLGLDGKAIFTLTRTYF